MISVENIWPDWHIEKEIGRGSYGTVYLAKSHHAGIEYFSAVKVISIPSSSAELDSLRAELNNNEASLKTYLNNWKNDMVKEIEVMLPLNGMQNIVTAVTLSTSKNKEAPLAMLDTLQKTVEVNNLTELFDGIRKDVTEGITKEEGTKAANLETLREIAQSATTIVEVVSESTNKSVF